MEFAPTLACSVALNAFDLPAKSHDLRLHDGERQIVASTREREQARQPFCLSQRPSRIGKPLFLV